MSETPEMFELPPSRTKRAADKPTVKRTGFYYAAAIQYTPDGAAEPVWSTEMYAPILWRPSSAMDSWETVVKQGLRNFADSVIAGWNTLSADVRYTLLTQAEYDQVKFGVRG